MRKLVLCEKPSVARDLARALGIPTRSGGPFEGDSLVITWCIGHLIELADPTTYSPAWRRWSFTSLPMLPSAFQLQPIQGTQAQWRVVRDLLRRRDFAAVINACDAGREGELIFRFCYELSGCTLPIERLWISSLTEAAIRRGMASLRPGRELDALAAAARCRAQADWLVGLNATRAVTLWRGGETLLSLGRVQTPTLSLIVARDDEIARFVPRDYFEVEACLQPKTDARRGEADKALSFVAHFAHGERRRFAAPELADAVVARDTQIGSALVEEIAEKTVREPPPLLFDLGALQRTCNRRFGWSADGTLKLAQALYEKHKLITYPRTDSRYLSSDLGPQLPRLFSALSHSPTYAPHVQPLLSQGQRSTLPRRVFADAKVTDHHAIIPTSVDLTPARLEALAAEDRRLLALLDLIVRRFVAAFYPDAEFRETQVRLRVDAKAASAIPARPRSAPQAATANAAASDFLTELPPPPDRYHARGRVRIQAGWQTVAGYGDAPGRAENTDAQDPTAGSEARSTASRRRKSASQPASRRAGEPSPDKDADEAEDEERRLASQDLPPLVAGQRLLATFARKDKQTRPPPRFTEATLLSAMEGAGKALADEDLRQAMRDHGLGTPATRAAIIETLLDRGYIARSGKQLVATALGADLIHSLPVPELASAELTGRWEARLSAMARGQDAPQGFLHDIAAFVADLVQRIQHAARPEGPLPVPAGATSRRRSPQPESSPRQRRSRSQRSTQGQATRKSRRPRSDAAAPSRSRRKRGSSSSNSSAAPTSTRRRTAPSERPPRRASSDDSLARSPSRPSRRQGPLPTPATTPSVSTASASPASSSYAGLGSTSPGSKVMPPLVCPRCQRAELLWGKRGWGCSNFRICPLVIPFSVAGQRLTVADLRLLCSGLPLYLASAGQATAIRLDAARSEAPFLGPI